MNVLLAIPTSGSPAAPFLAALRALRMPECVTAFDRLTITGNFIPGQRELAVRRALALGADVIMMVDDDMIVPPDMLERLLDALASDAELAIVGGLYYSRDGVHPMVADRWHSSDTTSAVIPAFTNTVTRCDAVGFGCVAIRMRALATMPAPYFNTQVYVEEHAAHVRICNEDYLLCESIRRAGWQVALHADVRCKHYDRVTGLAFPTHWEDEATTDVERVLVVEPGPFYRVIRYDGTLATKPERHATATIDYIIVE